jgi:hypothetical protein
MDHTMHERYDHEHQPGCGHVHDGHLHHSHGGHVDECTLEVVSKDPASCAPQHAGPRATLGMRGAVFVRNAPAAYPCNAWIGAGNRVRTGDPQLAKTNRPVCRTM